MALSRVTKAGQSSSFMPTPAQPIEVFNRYTGAIEHEPVHGERWLRWTYDTPVGRLALALAIKRRWLSRLFGRWMDSRPSAGSIRPFIARYRLDVGEFADAPETFRSFNDFFARRLKPEARPICPDRDAVVFPADGRHLGIQDLGATSRIYAKGQWLDLKQLLGDAPLAQRFAGGTLLISRLCPIDYHRFHFPCAGDYAPGRPIDGVLYSVSPIALRRTLGYLLANRRMVSVLHTREIGDVAIVAIGATFVGSIVLTARPGPVAKGEEKGCFRFGGSCVMTLFEPGRVRLADDLVAQSLAGRELYAHMGDRVATMS